MSNVFFDGKNTIPDDRPQIFVDQAGYLPGSRKTAVLTFPSDMFSIVDENGEKHFEGAVSHYGMDACSGDDVYTADFSAFNRSGSYRIKAGGMTSALFRIGKGVYNKLFRDTTKAFYYLRCGCALDEKYAGEYAHEACHTSEATIFGTEEKLDVSGGWHDAGDYGRYVTAGACACAQLLYAYKLFPKAFDELDLNIPESGSGIPDILSEIKYELEWLLKMQRADGSVYHKATTMRHAPFIMPEDDKEPLYVFPVSSMATADVCAVCALAAGIYRPFDKAFSDRLAKAAKLSYKWLEENPDFLGFWNPRGCDTGLYAETNDVDNRYWAAAEMFTLTGDKRYSADFVKMYNEGFERDDYVRVALGYSVIGGLGSLAYILCEREGRENSIASALKEQFSNEAYWLRDKSKNSGYGASMEDWDYYWGSNMVLMQHAMKFILAAMFTGNNEFYGYIEEQLHVLLGRNPLGISYVTGTGEYRCRSPHYRPSEADGIEESIPGLVIGGPNRNLDDPYAASLIPRNTPPMKCFVDHKDCYSLNEVTIYWNSPTVFVLAFLSGYGSNE
ncbi:MAG: glycoside hydrolase family 9 protein [Ruminiclostridium sp.]|nr:glycoside hydrolase family 9 protein [Ruminiclostridium sp.]